MEQDWPIWHAVVCQLFSCSAITEDTSASPYILLVIAALGERSNVCVKLTVNHLSSLGVHLRELPSKYPVHFHTLIQQLRVFTPDTTEGNLLSTRFLPIMQDMMVKCREPIFSMRMADGDDLDFWDIDRCDEELGPSKIHYK